MDTRAPASASLAPAGDLLWRHRYLLCDSPLEGRTEGMGLVQPGRGLGVTRVRVRKNPLWAVLLPPSLQVGWLKWRNAVCRWPLAAATVALSLILLGAFGRVSIVEHALGTLTGSPLLLLTVTAAAITAIILRRRRRLAVFGP